MKAFWRAERRKKMVDTIMVALKASKIIELVVIAVVMDTIFGAGRAVKDRRFNSSACPAVSVAVFSPLSRTIS